MATYFIYAPDCNAVKIGVAQFVYLRLANLQMQSPTRLRCIKILDTAGHQDERRLHKEFFPYRLWGEWFAVEGILQDYLKDDLTKSISDKPEHSSMNSKTRKPNLEYSNRTDRGHIRKKSKRSWYIQLYTGRDAKGKYQRYYETVRGSKEKATTRLQELLLQYPNGNKTEAILI